MRAPKEGTQRYARILKRGCGGRTIDIPGEPTEYDCDHNYPWECDYCPCCIEAQRAKYAAADEDVQSYAPDGMGKEDEG